MFGTLTPLQPMKWWVGLLLAGAITLLAGASRVFAGGLLATDARYLVFIAAVLLSAVIAGRLAGAFAAMLGGLIPNLGLVGAPPRLGFHDLHPWDLVVFLLVSCFIVLLAGAMSAALRRQTRLAGELAMVSQEYRHRVMNVISMAQALAQQTGRHAATVAEFEHNLLDRLQALARAQGLLIKNQGQPVPLAPLVDEILSPYNIETRLDAPAATPDVKVDASLAVVLALLLNELATNATKYGSLSVPEGRLHLRWAGGAGRMMTLTWKELQGPPVKPPRRVGFGSKLFKAGFTQPGGSLKLDYDPDGLRCQLTFVCLSEAGAAVHAA